MPTYNQVLKNIRKKKLKYNMCKSLKHCPQKKGVCFKITTMKPKKPNSATRKIAKLKLSTGKRLIAYIPGMGHNLQQHSVVLVRGGRVKDLPGIHYHLIRGKLDFSIEKEGTRAQKRSKYSIKKPKN
jgi:small subunit ribosomal protein S12